MTRQRIRPSLRRSTYEDCPACNGTGQVKTGESMAIEVMRTLLTTASSDNVSRIQLEIHERVANHLNNRKRREMARIEEECNVNILVTPLAAVPPEHLRMRCLDELGNEVRNLSTEDSKSRT